MTEVTHLHRLLFTQSIGVNCAVRNLFWGLSQNRVSGAARMGPWLSPKQTC